MLVTELVPPGLAIRSGGQADWPAIGLLLDVCIGERESPETQARWRSTLAAFSSPVPAQLGYHF